MDIHNMILFLQNDTNKPHPVGFENVRRNIFDPEEDPTPAVVEDSLKSDSSVKEAEVLIESDGEPEGLVEEHKACGEAVYCARVGCQKKPRFDSTFCSDSCGVSTLETDLLQSLNYAQELHPSAWPKYN